MYKILKLEVVFLRMIKLGIFFYMENLKVYMQGKTLKDKWKLEDR